MHLFICSFSKNFRSHWSATSGGMNNLSRSSRMNRKLIRRLRAIVGNAVAVSVACLQELNVSKDALHPASSCCFPSHHFFLKSLSERRLFRIKTIFCWCSRDDYQVFSRTQMWKKTHDDLMMISVSSLYQWNPPTAHSHNSQNIKIWEYTTFYSCQRKRTENQLFPE